MIFEKAPQLRTGGYIIDFWGVAYDVADRMGLLPALRSVGYFIQVLRMANRSNRTVATLDVARLRPLLRDRFVSVAPGDIAAALHRACQGVETHFGHSIAVIEQRPREVVVKTSGGFERSFDLVAGADGLHSAVRSIAFGPPEKFEQPLGFYVAAFSLPGYRPREELAYVS
ncbi:MAG: hypothetical protein ACLQVW_13850, partial [Limisphaerales bacterium]